MVVNSSAIGEAINEVFSAEMPDPEIEAMVQKLSIGDMRGMGRAVRQILEKLGVQVADDADED